MLLAGENWNFIPAARGSPQFLSETSLPFLSNSSPPLGSAPLQISPGAGNPPLSLLETPHGQMFAVVPPELPAAGQLSYHRQVWQIHVVVQLVLLHPALGQAVDVGVGLRVFPLH